MQGTAEKSDTQAGEQGAMSTGMFTGPALV
jgi:hypothetical protein